MANSRTEKSPYPSRYSPAGWVSGSQYITELICEKKARRENKDLPRKFWEDKDWEKYFKYQITLASQLIKKFGEEAVIAALKDNRCWSTYSLRSPFLVPVIEEKKKEISDNRPEAEYNIKDEEEVTHRSSNNKKSIISKLRDLDE